MQLFKLLSIIFFITIVSACDNYTGTCLHDGFHCVNGEIVSHDKRCDGFEDCTDGTDEFMCDILATPIFHENKDSRQFIEEATCVNCNCLATTYNVAQGSAWWNYAVVTPTDTTLMLGTGLPCNSKCVTTLTISFFKKNRICRGWLCCARQKACVTCSASGLCSTVTTANRCY